MRTPVSVFVVCINIASVCQPALAAAVPSEMSGTYSVAMEYAEDRAILEPLEDGQMHPEMPISRQDLVMSIVRDVYQKDVRKDCFDRISPDLHANFDRLFTDVPLSNAAAEEICVGMFVGVVEGRPDGSFGVQGTANLVDAAKIVTKAYGIAPLPGLRPVSGVPWHEPYWYALAKRNAIPETVKNRSATLTRAEFAEILYRLKDERPAQGFRYTPTLVKNVASANTPTTVATISEPNMSVGALNVSSGLLVQMHVESRRFARLERLARAERLGGEGDTNGFVATRLTQ